VVGETLQAGGDKLEDSLLDPRHQPVAVNKLKLMHNKYLRSIRSTQPPVRRVGSLEIAAPDRPEDGLRGQIAGQQASRPLEERQLCLVGLEPGMAQGQIGRAGGQLGPGLHQLFCNGLTHSTN